MLSQYFGLVAFVSSQHETWAMTIFSRYLQSDVSMKINTNTCFCFFPFWNSFMCTAYGRWQCIIKKYIPAYRIIRAQGFILHQILTQVVCAVVDEHAKWNAHARFCPWLNMGKHCTRIADLQNYPNRASFPCSIHNPDVCSILRSGPPKRAALLGAIRNLRF